MAKARNITTGYRCDSQESKNHLCEAFVPPRPRDRHRPKKGDHRAGYWCRRTTFLAKKVAIATREAREAKDAIQAMEKQMKEMKQLLTAPLRQGVLQRNLGVRRLQAAIRGHRDRQQTRVLGAQQVADTQELLAPPEADAHRAQAASRLQAFIRGRYETVTGCVQYPCRGLCAGQWKSMNWYCYARRLLVSTLYFDCVFGADNWDISASRRIEWNTRSFYRRMDCCSLTDVDQFRTYVLPKMDPRRRCHLGI